MNDFESKLFDDISARIDALANVYKWRGDAGFVPNATERYLMADFARGILSNEVFAAKALEYLRSKADPCDEMLGLSENNGWGAK